MRIVTNDEMKSLDDKAVEQIGIPSLVLMENAGLEASRVIHDHLLERNYVGEVLVFCGKGKNGGDGLVVARRLLANGHKVRVFLLHPEEHYTNEASVQLRILKNEKARISVVDSALVIEQYFQSATPPFIAVDALIGTGLKRSLEGLYYDVVEILNKYATEIISLDIPTGVMGDTGRIAGTAIDAIMTISFGYPKLGHFLPPGAAKRGELHHVDLGFPREWVKEGDKFLFTHDNTATLLQKRDRYGHKNSFGHCLLIGGSPGRIGAVEMASHSCLKMGTGLVTVASWEDSFPALEQKLSSEIMSFRIAKDSGKFVVPSPGLSAFSSVVIGPGLGMRPDGAEVLSQLIDLYQGPLVIDADGLNLLAEHKFHSHLSKRRFPTVLTPHPGEMSRLLGISKDEVVEDPTRAVRTAVEYTGAIVVLKGATSLIHSADGMTWFNHYPNDGMATAGSGDVLAGMIGGLLGQRMNPVEATRLGVYIHSLSGEFAAKESGHRAMTALDIIDNIRLAFKDLRDYKTNQYTQPCINLI